MNYLPVEVGLQEVFRQHMALSAVQSGRIAELCTAVLLAGEVRLSRLAQFLGRKSQEDSRIRWISRLLEADFLTQEYAYHSILKYALESFHSSCWHLIIDRTTLNGNKKDVATITLHYHKRAIPLVWCFVPFGGVKASTYIDLIQHCVPLIPNGVSVVFHGDAEFGAVEIMRTLRHLGWDFMLGQRNHKHFWQPGADCSQALASLQVQCGETYQLANIELGKEQRLSALNLIAFRSICHSGGQRRRKIAYVVTSLPLKRGLKRLGRRRWGTEPFYRDYKSSGWHINDIGLQCIQRLEGLFVILALTYLWAVCLGRWLCKTGQRRRIDAKRRRHLSLFRIGLGWLVHCLRTRQRSPAIIRLYS